MKKNEQVEPPLIGCSLIGLSQGDTFAWDDGRRRWRLQVLSVQRE